MQVANLYKNSNDRPVISLEFSRPKTEKAAANLEKALDSLTNIPPDYVSVTFGAGGSTREGSYELVDKLKNQRGLNVVAYIAGIGLAPDEVEGVIVVPGILSFIFKASSSACRSSGLNTVASFPLFTVPSGFIASGPTCLVSGTCFASTIILSGLIVLF